MPLTFDRFFVIAYSHRNSISHAVNLNKLYSFCLARKRLKNQVSEKAQIGLQFVNANSSISAMSYVHGTSVHTSWKDGLLVTVLVVDQHGDGRTTSGTVRHVGGALHSRQHGTDSNGGNWLTPCDLRPSALRMECDDDVHEAKL